MAMGLSKLSPLLSSGGGSGKTLMAAFASRFVLEAGGFLTVCLIVRVLAGNFFPLKKKKKR